MNKILIAIAAFFLMFGVWAFNEVRAGIFDDIKGAITGHYDDLKERVFVENEYADGLTIATTEFKYTKDSLHWAEGSVSIVKDGDKKYLQLHGDFEAGLAPDLYVYISSDIIKSQADFDKLWVVELAKLKKGSGASYYEIETALDIKSIIIQCKRFNQFMGSALIES